MKNVICGWYAAVLVILNALALTVTVPLTVRDVKVPTLVNDESVIPDANVEPVSVPAADVTVQDDVNVQAVPLIVVVALVVANVPLVGNVTLVVPVNVPVNP